MDKSEARRLFEGPRLAFESRGHELSKRWQFEALAELNAPYNVARSYAAGLDAIQSRLSYAPPAFTTASEHLVQILRNWAGSAEHAHYDFIRAMKNPNFKPTLETIFQAAEYASGFSLAKLAGDAFKQFTTGLASSSGDIKKVALYYAMMSDIDVKVYLNFYEHVAPTLAGAAGSSRAFYR